MDIGVQGMGTAKDRRAAGLFVFRLASRQGGAQRSTGRAGSLHHSLHEPG